MVLDRLGKTSKTKIDKPSFALEPIQDRVIILVHKQTETPAGVIIPETIQQTGSYETPTGEVMFHGPDCKQVKKGDVVLCNGSLPCVKVWRDGFAWVSVRECDILAILRPAPTA